MAQAVAMVPAGARVSAGNQLGAHLSERRRIYTFPVVRDADYVVVDRTRPMIGFVPQPAEHERRLRALERGGAFGVVFAQDGVVVLRRRETG
jgi:hypothetical protein